MYPRRDTPGARDTAGRTRPLIAHALANALHIWSFYRNRGLVQFARTPFAGRASGVRWTRPEGRRALGARGERGRQGRGRPGTDHRAADDGVRGRPGAVRARAVRRIARHTDD